MYRDKGDAICTHTLQFELLILTMYFQKMNGIISRAQTYQMDRFNYIGEILDILCAVASYCGTRIAIAGTIIYINVLSTCVTRRLTFIKG